MKNTQSKIKPIKTGKELGTTYCAGCKDFTHNFRPQEVKITKVLREKSNCVVCRSAESRFLKQKQKIIQSFTKWCYEIMKTRYVKEQEAKGLLSNLGIKTLLSKIPLLNVLF